MEELIKVNKLINFCNNVQNALKDDNYDIEKLDVIITINRVYEKVIEDFNYDFNKLYNSITKLDSDICDGDVYKILEDGNLKEDGYEKGYLFLMEESSILLHYHYNEKEHYKCIFGDNTSISKNFCDINSSHEITSVNTNTIVRTYKYIPESMIK